METYQDLLDKLPSRESINIKWWQDLLDKLPSRESINIKWWVVEDGQRFRNQSTLRGKWAYEATCGCGWDSKTGGAVRSYIQQAVSDHKSYDHQ